MKTEKLPIYKKYLHVYGKSPFVRAYASLYQEEKDGSKSLETLINGKGRELILITTLPLLTGLCLKTSHNWPSPSSDIFFCL